ncbi:hypothetical protein TSUD_139850 [Trifolium subterraneum]|uniref:Uncharacterized protein n=1 Tax=Trifolium subterraneum TaxID=3900 RepID=A0A2Z6NXN0_TRISU|nr:hypothetical protein TSUD_139850 [Trifolium subterraneum]
MEWIPMGFIFLVNKEDRAISVREDDGGLKGLGVMEKKGSLLVFARVQLNSVSVSIVMRCGY